MLDTVLWIIAIVIGAANMVVEGLYEARLDYRVIRLVSISNAEDEKTELLVGVISEI